MVGRGILIAVEQHKTVGKSVRRQRETGCRKVLEIGELQSVGIKECTSTHLVNYFIEYSYPYLLLYFHIYAVI